MLLSDKDIRHEIVHGQLRIRPVEDIQFQPASVDLRLGDQLRESDGRVIYHLDDGYELGPGRFILGDTVEKLVIPDYLAAQFAGKSSLGRIGLQTHCTAGFVDPGFEGTLTVELSNLSENPIMLISGQYIGQVCFFRLSSPALRPYGHPEIGSRYQNQSGPTIARGRMIEVSHG